MSRIGALIASLILSTAALAQSPSYIWWEAEKPAATNFPPAQKGDAKEQDVLSEGLWIGVGNDRNETKFLEYDVNVPAAGDYQMYARKFWQHGPFRWHFDGQAWQEVGKKCTLLDAVELRTNWVANWVPMGGVKLDAGKHKLRLELLENTGVAYFDAFVLTNVPFVPRGKVKPDAPFAPAPEGWVNFDPGLDTFASSPIDLRPMNEKVAGQNGFIGVDGESFVYRDSKKPIKFWAVNAGPAVIDMPRAYVDSLAKFLAKRGVNMVRMHGPLYIQSGPQAGQVDKKHLDNVFYFVSALKREGIYAHLSIHFQHWLNISQLPQFEGYAADTLPFAIHFFNADFQRIYRSWWDALLTTQNPYTGNALKDEPSMSSLELLNEDSFFFWTFDYARIPAPQMRILEKQFAAWLTTRYGSPEKALKAWGGESRKEDAAADGRIGFVPLWHIFSVRDQRAKDTALFLAEVQRRFFDDNRDYVHQLGFKGAVCASNWITASPNYLEPIDTWTNAGVDFFDHHGYFDHPSKKNVSAFAFQPGDQYADRSAVRLDPPALDKPRIFDFPFLDVVQDGKPSMVSEFGWNNPNRFRSEMPLFASSLASLDGMDAMVLFALDSVPQWRGTETENYWPIQTPTDIGQSPAASLIFRQSLVREAPAVATVNVNVKDMFDLKGVPARSGQLQDFVRAADAPKAGEQQGGAKLDARYFAVGKVSFDYSNRPSSTRMVDLSKYVNAATQQITSANGDTQWDYGKGLFMVRAPGAQGVTGFLRAGGTIALPDISIESGMEFGSIVAVAMDGKPLRDSGRILLQVMSEQRNAGWQADGPEGQLKTIKSVGEMPIQYRAFSGTVKLNLTGTLEIQVLDWNGAVKKTLPAGNVIQLDPAMPYYVVERT